ncbi:MFS transporter [Gluconobacter cerinus]|uniref:MFS transporter n=1 Tax=Gluconobacter cerinus TaxID=38307 RepID=UPI003AB7A931
MTGQLNEISRREKVAYGCGDLSSNLMWGLTSAYLMFYYTDIYGIPAASVAWILLIARVFDAFCDPAIGWVVDRKGGLFIRPLIRNLAIPLGLADFFCFLPLPLSPTGKILWAGGTYIIFGAVYSCINTPYGALAPMMTKSARERVDLNSFRMMGCQVGQFCIAALTIPAITWLGGGSSIAHRQRGITIFVLLLSCVGIVLWRMVSTNCVARYPTTPARHDVRKTLRLLFKNRLWLICNTIVFQQFIVIAALYGFAIYYVKCVLGGTDALGGAVLTLASVCSFTGAALCPMSSRRFGIMMTAFVATVLQGLAYATMLLCGAWLPGFLIAFVALALGQGLMSPISYVFLAAAIDNGRAVDGTGAAGLAYSINTLISKVSMGVTGFVLALCLSYGHYDATSLVLNQSTAAWVTAGFVILPLVSVIIQYVLLLLWKSVRGTEKDLPVTAR